MFSARKRKYLVKGESNKHNEWRDNEIERKAMELWGKTRVIVNFPRLFNLTLLATS